MHVPVQFYDARQIVTRSPYPNGSYDMGLSDTHPEAGVMTRARHDRTRVRRVIHARGASRVRHLSGLCRCYLAEGFPWSLRVETISREFDD